MERVCCCASERVNVVWGRGDGVCGLIVKGKVGCCCGGCGEDGYKCLVFGVGLIKLSSNNVMIKIEDGIDWSWDERGSGGQYGKLCGWKGVCGLMAQIDQIDQKTIAQSPPSL